MDVNAISVCHRVLDRHSSEGSLRPNEDQDLTVQFTHAARMSGMSLYRYVRTHELREGHLEAPSAPSIRPK